MTVETYRHLLASIREIPSIQEISFWGFGEPLLHPDIGEMIRLATDRGLRSTVITNGVLLKRDLAEVLAAAGLHTLVISIDGTVNSTLSNLRPGTDLGWMEQGIRAWQDAKDATKTRSLNTPSLGLAYVMMRRNLHELSALPQLANHWNADFIFLTNLVPYSEELKDDILYGISPGGSIPATRIEKLRTVVLPRLDIKGNFGESLARFLIAAETYGYKTASHYIAEECCPFVMNATLTVTSDGSVSPCVPLMATHKEFALDRFREIQRCVFGNVNRESIAQIWRHPRYRSFRERVIRFNFSPCTDCGGCHLHDSNKSDCFGNCYPTCGNCLWARGVMVCP